MSNKTVFISYRRNPIGKLFAGRISDSLKHLGYDVFLDVDTLTSGAWQSQIGNEVTKRGHFILVLTPDSLTQCNNKNDMVRFEIETAISSKRNIVLVKEETQSWSEITKNTPKFLQKIFKIQGIELRHNSFNTDILELSQKYIPPHLGKASAKNVVIHNTKEANNILYRFKAFFDKLSIAFMPIIDSLLSFFILFALGLIIYSKAYNDNWDYLTMVPVTFSLKLFWSTLSLPKETRMAIQVVLLIALCISLVIFSAMGKFKEKEHLSDSSVLTIVALIFGTGFAYGVATFATIFKPNHI